MTQYLIFPTEQEALDRSHRAHVGDTARKMKLSEEATAEKMAVEDYVTLYRWAIDVGKDGQTALVIDGDEQLLTAAEQAALVPTLPSGPGENWEKPGPPVNSKAPEVSQQAGRLICTTGTWADPQPEGFSYQWVRGDNVNIGTDAPEYPITPDEIDSMVSCIVTATNPMGPTSVESNAVLVAGGA